LNDAVLTILNEMKGHPHIFNLGHGILPQTPIAHVDKVLSLIRNGI